MAIKTWAVADDGREFEDLMIAALEWSQGAQWFWDRLVKHDGLTRRQCRELWEFLGRIDKPPKRLQFYFDSEDVKRTFPKPLLSRH